MIKNNLGLVIIGRNEGERLRACIQSAIRSTDAVVYVDSGSTDNSVALAKELGAELVNLDLSLPFTAARARNAGFDCLISHYPSITYVQFVDGDCELVENWLQQGVEFLSANTQFAVVCGRRRERFPNASIYNLICDIEWDTAIGEAKSCGGDALMRVDALQSTNGFNASLIAGEEPELCVRLRQAGWKIYRLDAEMTLHDAAMTHFEQWWKRCKRAGFAYAQGVALHGAAPERHWLRELRSTFFWGGLLPLITLTAAIVCWPWGGGLLFVFPVQIIRLALRGTRTRRENWLYASFLVLGKIPELVGAIDFYVKRILGKQAYLIEYKRSKKF